MSRLRLYYEEEIRMWKTLVENPEVLLVLGVAAATVAKAVIAKSAGQSIIEIGEVRISNSFRTKDVGDAEEVSQDVE